MRGPNRGRPWGHFQRTTRAPTTRESGLKSEAANLAGAWSAQPVPASPRPPHAAHRGPPPRAPRVRRRRGAPAARARPPPTAPRPRAYAGGGPWRRIAPSCRPMAGRRPFRWPWMTRAHDRHVTLPQRRRTLCTKIPSSRGGRGHQQQPASLYKLVCGHSRPNR